ncbi:LysR family transcriptional regulator [Aliikangiella marina]|uniref:LysR family transcriptional regulator n=1 Tax=Aliikangiella marina TaxID=1712262 RepID=A0A545TJM4_9GAMM|nr:LysR family transcriptional regulator [Aliikangiella marina]TQV77407.1 LysR family transcriptional regulator [Aliikangiella marina]
MDTELLKTFLEVKNTRHFGRAAENLYLTQAAVSARIKQLESTLGVTLFTRYRNNLQLTPAGERLIDHAESMLNAWERARAAVSLKKKQQFVLSFGGTSGLWDLILQDALNETHRKFPNLALRAESHGQDVLIRRLVERTLDIALVYEPAKITDLVSKPIAQAELVLVSTNQLQQLESALNTNYVAVDWGTAFEINFSQVFQDLAPPIMNTTLARIALEFIMDHGGSAYLPQRMVADLLGKSLFQIQEAPTFNRPIFACYHHENRNTDTIEEVLKLVSDIAETD